MLRARRRSIAFLALLVLPACGGGDERPDPAARAWWRVARAGDVSDEELDARLRDALQRETAASRSWTEITPTSVRGVLTFRAGIAEVSRASAIARVAAQLELPGDVESGALYPTLGWLMVKGADAPEELAAELEQRVAEVAGVSAVTVSGAPRQRAVVELDALSLGVNGLHAWDVCAALADAEIGDEAALLDALIAPGVALRDLAALTSELDETVGLMALDGAAVVAVEVHADPAHADEAWSAIETLSARKPGVLTLRAASSRRWVYLPPGTGVAERRRLTLEVSRRVEGLAGVEHALVSSVAERFPRALPAPSEAEVLEVLVWGAADALDAFSWPAGLHCSGELEGAPLHVLSGALPDELATLLNVNVGANEWTNPPELLGHEVRSEVDVPLDGEQVTALGLTVDEVAAQLRDEWTVGGYVVRIAGGFDTVVQWEDREIVCPDGRVVPFSAVAEIRMVERAPRRLYSGGRRAVFVVGGSADALEEALEMELPGAAQFEAFE